VGGSLAIAGGAALATYEVMAYANNTQVDTPIDPMQKKTPAEKTQLTYKGQVREYWIQVDAFFHNLVPTGVDGMMGMQYQADQTSYWALGYRAYTPNWGSPLSSNDDIGANTGIPGPILRGEVGDTIRIHFRNNDTHYQFPHSMHPHGVLYTPANDGAWVVSNKQPGSAILPGDTYTYEWTVRPNSVGTWVYHDHSTSMDMSMPIDPTMATSMNHSMELSAELGMFGFLVLTEPGSAKPDKEFFTFLHDIYQDDVSTLAQDFDCFNGYSYLGNTPTFTARVGQKIRWHVGALGKEFHAFHLHGHRWLDTSGRFVDVVLMGPSMATYFDFVADNPGKWLYHCHVTDHMMGGMMGMYIIS